MRIRKKTAPQKFCRWFYIPQEKKNSILRLFCFHYAGGMAEIYSNWVSELPDNIEMCAVQLPGRSYRLSENPYNNMPDMLNELKDVILPLLDKPFSFFGHSLGALIALELAQCFYEKGLVHLFISGSPAPQNSRHFPLISELPDLEILQVLRFLDGTSDIVLNNEDLIKLFMPTIRADFMITETWRYSPSESFHFPIWAFCGSNDPGAARKDMKGWKNHTINDFKLFVFPGGHFFIHNSRRSIINLIGKALTCRRS